MLQGLVVPGTRLALMVSPGLGASHHGPILQQHGPPVPTGLRAGAPERDHLPVGLQGAF